MIKKIIFFIIFTILFTFPANAEGNEEYNESDLYQEKYEESQIGQLEDLIDEDTKKMIDQFGFSLNDPYSTGGFSAENVFGIIIKLLNEGIGEPLKVFLSILGISILLGSVKSISNDDKNGNIVGLIGVSAVATLVMVPAFFIFKSAINTIKSAAVFMGGFVPIYAGVMISAGKPTSSALTSGTLILSAELCEQISGFVVLPFLSVYLAISIASNFSDKINISALSEGVQKTISFLMVAVMFVFSGVISLQGLIGNSADSMSLRTFKLLVSSTPIIGGAVGESTSIVFSCFNTLRNSAVIYAVICFIAIMLPMIVEILLWRISMFFAKTLSKILGTDKIASLCESVSYSFGILTSVTLNTLIMYIVSLTSIILTTGNNI